jgi:hypothetical protein
MKPTNYLRRALVTGAQGLEAWRLWRAQRKSIIGNEVENRLCAAARELAERRALESALFFALDEVYPFGLGGFKKR